MKILCIGQTTYDLNFPISHSFQKNRKYIIQNLSQCPGGPATNAAFLLANWGADTSLIARVGLDPFGQLILSQMKDAGISTESIYMDPKASTSISCVIAHTSHGERTVFNAPAQETPFEPVWPQADPDLILVDGRETKTALEALHRYPQAISIMDAGSYQPWTKAVGSLVDYFVCSEDLSRSYTNTEIKLDNLEDLKPIFLKLHEITSHTIVITIGERGVVYEKDNKIYHIPAYPAHTIDTTGAGDIFHGAFTYFIGQNLPLPYAIRMASLTASISTETIGALPSIPSLETVQKKKSEIKL